ncbi:MAG TPA: DUF488 family protein [Polyangia bacterium]|nr:DUF488 family protein [Polyangia bacterium]
MNAAEIKTRRWNDPVEPDDGTRILVTRYRPRGVRREDERWDAWIKELAPSVALHAAVYGKHGAPIDWDEYRRRYLREMESERYRILGLAQQVAAGERITLLCSSACVDPARCHRTLLAELISAAR